MQLPEIAANEATVKAATQHLIDAFNEFVDSQPDGAISYADGLMIAHNIHIHLLLDLEARNQMDHGQKLALRKIAVDTFKTYLERRP